MSNRMLFFGFLLVAAIGGPLAGATNHYLSGDPASADSVRSDAYCGDSVRDNAYCPRQEQEQWQWQSQSAQNSASISSGVSTSGAAGGGGFTGGGGSGGFAGGGGGGGFVGGGGTTIVNVNQTVNQTQSQWQSQSQDICCTVTPQAGDEKLTQPSGPPITGPSNPVARPTTPPQ